MFLHFLCPSLKSEVEGMTAPSSKIPILVFPGLVGQVPYSSVPCPRFPLCFSRWCPAYKPLAPKTLWSAYFVPSPMLAGINLLVCTFLILRRNSSSALQMCECRLNNDRSCFLQNMEHSSQKCLKRESFLFFFFPPGTFSVSRISSSKINQLKKI